jgi:hypothetical protein
MRPRLLLIAAALGLTGCNRGFFAAKGAVASEGPARIDNWNSTPQGCIRAGIAKPNVLFAFVWENPGVRDPSVDNTWAAPDAPMRLEFSRAQPVTATLQTIRHNGISLDAANCSVLRLQTSEHADALSGTVALDCSAHGNHLTANVTFERCHY